MTNIMQKIRGVASKTIIMASLVPLGLLATSTVQAASCPCFTSTIIDATIAKGGGGGVKGMLDGTNGGFSCEDNGDAVNLRFNNADHSVNISVFGEITSGSPGPGCGWSGRPLDTTIQEARECQNQITESWAWEVLGCPKL